MPVEGVPLTADDKLMSVSELERVVRVFAGLGVSKIRLTGGEPLVRRDIVDIVGEVIMMSSLMRQRLDPKSVSSCVFKGFVLWFLS